MSGPKLDKKDQDASLCRNQGVTKDQSKINQGQKRLNYGLKLKKVDH